MWNYDPQWIYKRVGALRLELGAKFADKHGLFAKTGTVADFKFAWVTDFPMYEWNEETKTWDGRASPFTSPPKTTSRPAASPPTRGRPRPRL